MSNLYADKGKARSSAFIYLLHIHQVPRVLAPNVCRPSFLVLTVSRIWTFSFLFFSFFPLALTAPQIFTSPETSRLEMLHAPPNLRAGQTLSDPFSPARNFRRDPHSPFVFWLIKTWSWAFLCPPTPPSAPCCTHVAHRPALVEVQEPSWSSVARHPSSRSER